MSTTAVAYQLTPEHTLETYGGTSHLRDGLTLNIGDALKEGADEAHPQGLIVTDDPLIIDTLNGRDDLHRAPVPQGALLTSHQLATPGGPAHERDKRDVPAIASEQITMSGMEIAAAQLAGVIPISRPPATEAELAEPAQPGHPDSEQAAAETGKQQTATVTPPPPVTPPPAPAGASPATSKQGSN